MVTIDADRVAAIYEGGWMSSRPPRRGSAGYMPYTTPDGWTHINDMDAPDRYTCTIDMDGAEPVVVRRPRTEVLELLRTARPT